MTANPNAPMNALLRRAGNRSRALPNIGQEPYTPPSPGRRQALMAPPGAAPPGMSGLGQTPAVQAANQVLGTQPGQAPMPGQIPPQQTPPPQTYAAPPTPPLVSPPGQAADPQHYNYQPEADGAWRVYPPGVPAPQGNYQASLPRAASTADYRRMRQAFMQPQMASAGQPPVQVPPPPGLAQTGY